MLRTPAILLAAAVVVLPGTVRQAPAETQSTPTAYGDRLGDLDGVSAYSSGDRLGKTPEQGNLYQCTELIKRWMTARNVAWVPVGLARNFFLRAMDGKIKGVEAYRNGSGELPQVGDVLCLDDGQVGHLALVYRTHANSLELLEQNWHATANYQRSVSMSVGEGHVVVAPLGNRPSRFQVQGWVRLTFGPRLVRVPASREWAPSGIRVTQGQRLRITTTGTWTHGPEGRVGVVRYSGDGFDKRDSAALIPTERIGTLIGRVGKGVPFRIGREGSVTAASTGELQLSINDVPGAFGNNEGELVCRIEVE